MKFKHIALMSLALAASFSSCSDYLEQEPPSSLPSDGFFTSEAKVKAAADQFYGDVLPGHANWSYGLYAGDVNTDNQINWYGDSKFATGLWKTANDNGNWSWNNIRNINYQLNSILEAQKAGKISGSEAIINQYIGEIYFMRAYCYFDMLQKWGDLPIVTEAFPDNEEILVAANKRQPCNEVARFIMEDLDKAISLMQDGFDKNHTRISPDAARLFKSRVALYEGSWLTYFAGTAFVPNGEGWPGKAKEYNANYQYPTGSVDAEAKYFLQESAKAAEMVADKYKDQLMVNTGTIPQKEGDPQNPYFNIWGTTDMSGTPEVILWRQYSKELGVVNNVEVGVQHGDFGVGLTRSMVEGYVMKDGKPTYAHHDGYVYEDTTTHAVVRNRDPRLFIFLKRPGQKNVLQGEDNNIAAEQVRPIEPVPQVFTRSFDVTYTTGYAIRKGGTFNQNLAENQAGYTASITFRATEALLNYIEAQYMLDHHLNAKSISYWKAIREAAGFTGEAADPQTTIAATDMAQELKGYTDGSGTQYDWGAFSAGKALTDPTLYSIRRERRTELMAEGLRWMDLIRWRSLDQLMKQPYQLEGFHLWNTPMEKWYTVDQLVDDGSVTATVSSRKLTEYFRPYQIVSTNMLYNGMTWSMAQYLQPMPLRQFMLTAPDHKTYGDSPLYQNPYWPMEPDEAAEQ